MIDFLPLSIGIGLAVSLLFSEIFGLAAGGMIVPGYIGLYLNHRIRSLRCLLLLDFFWCRHVSLVAEDLANVAAHYGYETDDLSNFVEDWLEHQLGKGPLGRLTGTRGVKWHLAFRVAYALCRYQNLSTWLCDWCDARADWIEKSLLPWWRGLSGLCLDLPGAPSEEMD